MELIAAVIAGVTNCEILNNPYLSCYFWAQVVFISPSKDLMVKEVGAYRVLGVSLSLMLECDLVLCYFVCLCVYICENLHVCFLKRLVISFSLCVVQRGSCCDRSLVTMARDYAALSLFDPCCACREPFIFMTPVVGLWIHLFWGYFSWFEIASLYEVEGKLFSFHHLKMKHSF